MANEYTTYSQVGKKEDVSDIITDITPFDTPAFTLFKQEKVNARTFSWLEDALASTAVNAQLEGADATNQALTDATERTNQTQILSKTFAISATADAVATYGRARESAHQLAKALKEIKRDLERAMVGEAGVSSVNTDNTTARKMKSVIDQISTTIDADASDATGNEKSAPYAGTALIEDMLLDAGQVAYDNGSDVDTFMIKPADARTVAGFSASSGRNREIADSKTLVNAIDLYVSPYGEYKVVLNRHMKTDTALLIDPSMFRTCVLRPITRELLAKNGDSDRHFVVGEMSVKHMNFGDSVKITNLG